MGYFADVNIPGFVAYANAAGFCLEGLKVQAKADFKKIYEENRDRVYSLAFWMTDSEIEAEGISTRVFLKSFHHRGEILIAEFREIAPIGNLTLNTKVETNKTISGNTKRIHLERAVVQLPMTERLAFMLHDVEGYDHARISKLIGVSEEESMRAVFHARNKVRELVAKMI
jgi:DNA-directed RNA polymerase specialized sigma24 family protein